MVNRKQDRKFHIKSRGNQQRPHVLLIVETAMSFGRGVLEGISQYLVENPPWSVQLDLRELLVTPPAWLENWGRDHHEINHPRDGRPHLKIRNPNRKSHRYLW